MGRSKFGVGTLLLLAWSFGLPQKISEFFLQNYKLPRECACPFWVCVLPNFVKISSFIAFSHEKFKNSHFDLWRAIGNWGQQGSLCLAGSSWRRAKAHRVAADHSSVIVVCRSSKLSQKEQHFLTGNGQGQIGPSFPPSTVLLQNFHKKGPKFKASENCWAI